MASPLNEKFSKPGLILGILVAFLAPFAFSHTEPRAEESVTAAATPTVSDAELERYIGVYKAMHADHGLTIEEAVRPQGLTVEEFRALERRVQDNPRLVEKVRAALLEFARANSAVAAAPTPTPPQPAKGASGRKRRQ
ncbi:MAG: hypothetical protein KatS3mg077_2650 [Candidatus Binatia bacterium]|nr:MAG: hypothetical protein KatS3mg077_2650 [Candidatus Binatia bacterium]